MSRLRFVICYWIASAVFTASIAKESGRSAVLWFLCGLLFGPLALLAVGLYGTARGPAVIPVESGGRAADRTLRPEAHLRPSSLS